MKKKFYTSLPIVIGWAFICILGLAGFIWECIDIGEFVLFSFITSIVVPFGLLLVLIVIFSQYVTIDEHGIEKKFYKKVIKSFKWQEIREIRIDSGAIYISVEELNGEKKEWNKENYFYFMYSDKAINTIKKYISNIIKINFDL